jgi:ABC-type transport system involved in multi-copper enzyme maturation permease subunit
MGDPVIAGLVRKEIRDLRPFLALGVFLLLLEVGDWFLQDFDTRTLQADFAEEVFSVGVVMFLLSFAVGTGLLTREVDDRTLGFLDGLPVTRTRVFGIKYLATAGMLLLYPAGYALLLLAQQGLARGSLDHALHPGLLLQAFLLTCLVTCSGLALGMLLGFLRNLCWLLVALLVITLKVVELYLPAVAVVNPVELVQPQLIGAHWQVSGAALVIQSLLLAGSLLLALNLFLKSGSDQGWKLKARLSRPFVSAAVTISTIVVLVAAFVLIMIPYEKRERSSVVTDKAPGTEFTVSPAGSARTQFYSFSYPAQQSSRTRDLLSQADDLYTAVAGILGAEPGARIDVDLSGSLQNTEGTAFHDRIRMRVSRLSRVALAHETAHVLARRLAGGEKERELSKMLALNEGLAEWIGNEVAGEGALTESIRFTAALVSQRRQVTAELVMDMDALSRVADQNLKYPLGAVLADATIQRYGRGALHKLLVAIGNPDFPRGLTGPVLWHAAYQAAGFDLALVLDDYGRQLKSWETEFADRIAALPRPRGSLVNRNGRLGVEMRYEGQMPAGWAPLVRFRPNNDSSIVEYSASLADSQGIAWMPPSRMAGKEVCFQPGVGMVNGAIIFETWVCLPRSTAARQ